jgi:hypothetical protein
MTSDLTILIPTWDRPDQVNQRLREIDAIWKGTVKVIVQVNPGTYTSDDIDARLYRGEIAVQQNNHNVGMVANIIYGIANIQTQWLWILGDDDKITNQAGFHIESGIRIAEEEQASGILFNQWHATMAASPMVSQNLETLLQSTGFSDILFITGFVWRLSFFQANIVTFVDYAYSRASQALILLASQAEGTSKLLIIKQPLIEYEYVVRWSRLDYLQRITALFTHPSLNPRAIRGQVSDLLWPQCRWAFLSAAHEQLKAGEITLPEWFGAAAAFSTHLFLSLPPAKAIQRISYIAQIPFQIYTPTYLLRLILSKGRTRLARLFHRRRPPTPIQPAR